jgi:hypothetical protein
MPSEIHGSEGIYSSNYNRQLMNSFNPSPKTLVVNELIEKGYIPDHDDALRLCHELEEQEQTDGKFAIGLTAVGIIGAGVTFAFCGAVAPLLVPIAAMGVGALGVWNHPIVAKRRDNEADFLRANPTITALIEAKLENKEAPFKIASAYTECFRAWRNTGQPLALPNVATPSESLPTATGSQIGNTTRFGAVDVPSSTAAHSPKAKSGFFDFNSLRTEPDNYTGFAIVGDMGTGKTRLIKYLARNILTTGRMSVMDIYARNNDWQGATVITSVDDFLPEMVDELEAIDALTEAYRNGQTVFEPHLFVVEEAADTLAEASNLGRTESKTVVRWLSRYLTLTRKIGKRLCLVSVNIKDLTDAIGSAEKRNSMVFIFPGRAAIAKAMTDTYIFKLGTSENREQREKLEKAIARINRPALIQHRGQWWVAEIPEVNADGSLVDGSSPTISSVTQATEPKTEAKPKTASTAEDLNRMFNMPSAETEIEEDAIESVSSRSSIQSAFPNWNLKTGEGAAKIIDWMAKKRGESFLPSQIKNSIHWLKTDKTIDNDRVKKLLDLPADKQLISVDESGRYSLLQQSTDDDYNF